MSLSVGLEALGHDAGLWDRVSSVLSTASAEAGGLTLTTNKLSWAAAEEGLVDTYEAARARVERLLREGTEETVLIASTLRDVKAQYEASDANARATFEGQWEPED